MFVRDNFLRKKFAKVWTLSPIDMDILGEGFVLLNSAQSQSQSQPSPSQIPAGGLIWP